MVPLKRDMLGCIIFGSLYMKCIICWIICIRLCLYLEFYLFGVGAFPYAKGRLHENREPLDLLGPGVPYCVDFKGLFVLGERGECSLVSFHYILCISYDSIPG